MQIYDVIHVKYCWTYKYSMYGWEVEQTCGPLVCALTYHWECPSKSKNQVDLCLKALVCFQHSSYAMFQGSWACWSVLKVFLIVPVTFFTHKVLTRRESIAPALAPGDAGYHKGALLYFFSCVLLLRRLTKGYVCMSQSAARCESSCPSMTDVGIVRQLLS